MSISGKFGRILLELPAIQRSANKKLRPLMAALYEKKQGFGAGFHSTLGILNPGELARQASLLLKVPIFFNFIYRYDCLWSFLKFPPGRLMFSQL